MFFFTRVPSKGFYRGSRVTRTKEYTLKIIAGLSFGFEKSEALLRASLGFVWDLLGFTGFYRAYRVLWGFMGVYGIVDRAQGAGFRG